MKPYIAEIFGHPIASYGLMLVLGAFAAFFLMAILRAYMRRSRPEKAALCADWLYAYLFAIAFAIIGAGLLKPVINIATFIFNTDAERYAGLSAWQIVKSFFGEIVFYGGLIGGAAGLILYCRLFKLRLAAMADIGAPALALGHAIGRVGCLLGGCCYGAKTDSDSPLAIFYPDYPHGYPSELVAPPHVPLIAVPIMESIFLVLLSAALALLLINSNKNGLTAACYLVCYGLWRFFIEYLRGDIIRGKYGPFTTSQYISLIAVLCGVAVIFWLIRKKEPSESAERF